VIAALRRLPGSVLALGLVSLLTDASSEMIYPLLPAFLASLGATGAMMGAVAGVADATSALTKLASGVLSDRAGRRKPLVILGYALASISRPLVAIAQLPWHVLAVRFADRVGKGIRSSPRDALLADATRPEDRGLAFGLHRAMDHAGALVGPLVAFALLSFGVPLRVVFALAAVPAALALVALFTGVREPAHEPAPAPKGKGAPLPATLQRYLVTVGLFTVANASDLFLLAAAASAGVSPSHVLLLWSAHHLVKATLAAPLGALSDRLGRRTVILAGWAVTAVSYTGFAFASSAWHVWALFAVYGATFGLTEGAEKALVAEHAPVAGRGRAFGAFHLVVGLVALPGQIGFGLLWDARGRSTAFLVAAAVIGGAFLVGLAGGVPPRLGGSGRGSPGGS
jgi:MFS family permease